MIYLALDIETTGLDPARDWIVEGGYARYDSESEEIETGSTLIVPAAYTANQWQLPTNRNGEFVSPNLFKEDIIEQGIEQRAAAIWFYKLIYTADILVAHNVQFERDFLLKLFADKPYDLTISELKLLSPRSWIDTCYDCGGRIALGKLCAKLNIDNADPHRAAADARASLDCLLSYGIDRARANGIRRRVKK